MHHLSDLLPFFVILIGLIGAGLGLWTIFGSLSGLAQIKIDRVKWKRLLCTHEPELDVMTWTGGLYHCKHCGESLTTFGKRFIPLR